MYTSAKILVRPPANKAAGFRIFHLEMIVLKSLSEKIPHFRIGNFASVQFLFLDGH